MKIVVNKTGHAGIPLREAEFGSVVTRSIIADSTYYLVTSAMDGSGRRILITLAGGTTERSIPQDALVRPVGAHVVIGDDVEGRSVNDGALARDAKRYNALKDRGTPSDTLLGIELDRFADWLLSK